MVSKYIQNQKISVEKYLELLGSNNHPSSYNNIPERSISYEEIYNSIIDITLTTLKKEVSLASQIIGMCSLLASSPFPREVFIKHFSTSIPKIELETTLQLFEAYGIIESFSKNFVQNENKPISMIKLSTQAKDYFYKKGCEVSSKESVLGFLIARFSDNNILKKSIEERNYFITHAEFFLQNSKMENSEPEILFKFAQLSLGMANYYSQTGKTSFCGTLLSNALQNVEVIVGKLEGKTAKEVCELLAEKDKKFPTLCANLFYQLARTYFNDQKLVPTEFEFALDMALKMREEIDNNLNSYDDSANKDGYTYIYKRHGQALAWIIQAETASNPEEYLKQAEALLLSIRSGNTSDKYHQIYCDELLTKIVLQRAKQEWYYSSRRKVWINDAEVYLMGGKTSRGLKVKGVIPELQKIAISDGIHREAKFYNLLGSVYLEKEQGEEAKKSYNQCINLSKTKDFPLAEALVGLAEIETRLTNSAQLTSCDNLESAKNHVKDALHIYLDILHRPRSHRMVDHALKLYERIETKLTEAQINNRNFTI